MTTAQYFDTSVEDIINKDILELLGGVNLPQEKKDELYAKMLETIRFRAITAVDAMLNDDDRKKWIEFIDKDDKDGGMNFLKTKGIDLTKIMLDEALNYKTEVVIYADYLKSVTKAVEKINQEATDKPKAEQ